MMKFLYSKGVAQKKQLATPPVYYPINGVAVSMALSAKVLAWGAAHPVVSLQVDVTAAVQQSAALDEVAEPGDDAVAYVAGDEVADTPEAGQSP